jgi:hypothetical protein
MDSQTLAIIALVEVILCCVLMVKRLGSGLGTLLTATALLELCRMVWDTALLFSVLTLLLLQLLQVSTPSHIIIWIWTLVSALSAIRVAIWPLQLEVVLALGLAHVR